APCPPARQLRAGKCWEPGAVCDSMRPGPRVATRGPGRGRGGIAVSDLPASPTPGVPSPAPKGPGARRWLLGLAGLLAAGLVGGGLVSTSGPARNARPPAADRFPVLPVSSSPFLNTGAGARYVGSEACRSCHAGRTASFRRTGMGRSLAEVDLAREPPDGDFDHP